LSPAEKLHFRGTHLRNCACLVEAEVRSIKQNTSPCVKPRSDWQEVCIVPKMPEVLVELFDSIPFRTDRRIDTTVRNDAAFPTSACPSRAQRSTLRLAMTSFRLKSWANPISQSWMIISHFIASTYEIRYKGSCTDIWRLAQSSNFSFVAFPWQENACQAKQLFSFFQDSLYQMLFVHFR